MLRGLLSFRGPYRILNFSWFAFFLTFLVWFNYAPFTSVIREDLQLTVAQVRTISLCNLALTIPARIIIGMVLDRFGPRITFSSLLVYAALPCLAFASAQNFNQLVLSRLAMGVVGAGFVVGIRLVGEWFPPKQIGFAQGIYGGWGNFGSFAAEAMLPLIGFGSAFLYAGHENWRFAIALTGVVSAIYGVIFYLNVQDTPPGKVYQRPSGWWHGSHQPQKLLGPDANRHSPIWRNGINCLALAEGEVFESGGDVRNLVISGGSVCDSGLSGLPSQSRSREWTETLPP